MTVSLKHKFASAKADGDDASLVRPSNWNDEHDLVIDASKIVGRTTSGTGSAEEIGVSSELTLASGTLGLAASLNGKTFTGPVTITSGTQTVSAPALDMTQTWNNAATTFTGYKLNVTDTASNASSLLMDLQVGGSTFFNFTKGGNLRLGGAQANIIGAGNTGFINFSSSSAVVSFSNKVGYSNGAGFGVAGFWLSSDTNIGFSPTTNLLPPDAIVRRRAAASLQLGAADAAAPVAQTFGVQSVVAGTTNTAGANFTIAGSQGTGTGAGGSIVFQVAPAGATGTAQNALSTALTIDGNSNILTPTGSIRPTASGSASGVLIGGNSSTSFAVISNNGINIRVTGFLSWSSAGGPNTNAAGDLTLYRDAANTLAQRNGVNAQAFRLYNTYTDASNYERGVFDWTTTANTLTIGTQNAGTGAARSLAFATGGTARLTINSSGRVTILETLTISGGIIRTNYINSADDSISWLHGNDTANGKMSFALAKTNPMFQFGGTTTSFPAIKRSTTSLQARLADDSAFTNIQGKLTTDTNVTAGTITPDSYLVLYDAAGTAYKVPCVAV